MKKTIETETHMPRTFFQRRISLVAKWLFAAFMIMMGTGQQNVFAATGPCDIYASGGTACVAAHSTTRALFGAYSGRLYQVRRASDGATTDIGTLAAGGYANAAAQDSFCAGTTCTITLIYDQSSRHNDLAVEGAGGAGAADVASVANALPVIAGGHLVYGVYIASGNGYRNNHTSGVAVGGAAEGMYMVASGTHVNTGCCFDYGNAETSTTDTGNGHMDAVNLGTTGPWVGADLENGIYGQPGTVQMTFPFVTAMLKNNGQTTFATKGGNAQSGSLTTQYNGALPNSTYIPMKLEGAIVLGTGGDNSRWSVGSFFEGAMTAGYPSDATENSVQANIVAVGYSGNSNGGIPGYIVGPGTKCVDVAGDDVGTDGTAVQLWDCQAQSVDQHWTYNGNNTLSSLGRCLDIVGNGTANNTQVQLYDCNGVGGQVWVSQPDGSLKNPQSGRCLDSPNAATGNGTRLQIYDCNSSAAQKFQFRRSSAGGTITGPGSKCVDVTGDDVGNNGAAVQLWDCQSAAVDQHWTYNSSAQTLSTLGRCLDINGNGTANNTQVELWDCNGVGGQKWVPQTDGSLKNPQSGRCLDSPNDATANGTRLQIYDCNSSAAQKFTVQGVSGGGGGGTGGGTACYAAWNSTTAYNGGAQVSYANVNYQANWWTQGQNPSTNNGPAGSGQPWTIVGSCS